MDSYYRILERVSDIEEKIASFSPQPSVRQGDVDGTDEIRTSGDFRQHLENERTKAGNAAAALNLAKASASGDTAHLPFADIVQKASGLSGLPAELIHAVVKNESNYNPRAVSPKGAQGLMQLMPDTAKELSVKDPFSPEDNILGGSRYLKTLVDRFGGNVVKALAAYNAGPQALPNGKIPNYPETRDYVKNVIDTYLKNSGLGGETGKNVSFLDTASGE